MVATAGGPWLGGRGQGLGGLVANRLSFGVLESAVKLSSHILSRPLLGPKVVIIQCFVLASRFFGVPGHGGR